MKTIDICTHCGGLMGVDPDWETGSCIICGRHKTVPWQPPEQTPWAFAGVGVYREGHRKKTRRIGTVHQSAAHAPARRQ